MGICSVCGADIKNGRCTFCGYKPTAADIEAERVWESEKRAMSGQHNILPKKIRTPDAPKIKTASAARRTAHASGSKPAVSEKEETARQMAKYAEIKRRNELERRKNAKRRSKAPLFVKLFVLLWIAAALYSVCAVLQGEAGIDIPGQLYKFLQWLVNKLDGESTYLVPEGNHVLIGMGAITSIRRLMGII